MYPRHSRCRESHTIVTGPSLTSGTASGGRAARIWFRAFAAPPVPWQQENYPRNFVVGRDLPAI